MIAGFGQGFAYNLSNTAGMEAMPDEKAGVASGVLQTSRLMGIVIGLALSGALFKSFENRQLFDDFRQTIGRGLSSANRSEVRGLLSGSDEARQRLAELAHHTRGVVDRIVDQAFVHGLRAVMVLSVVLCARSRSARRCGAARSGPGGKVAIRSGPSPLGADVATEPGRGRAEWSVRGGRGDHSRHLTRRHREPGGQALPARP